MHFLDIVYYKISDKINELYFKSYLFVVKFNFFFLSNRCVAGLHSGVSGNLDDFKWLLDHPVLMHSEKYEKDDCFEDLDKTETGKKCILFKLWKAIFFLFANILLSLGNSYMFLRTLTKL